MIKMYKMSGFESIIPLSPRLTLRPVIEPRQQHFNKSLSLAVIWPPGPGVSPLWRVEAELGRGCGMPLIGPFHSHNALAYHMERGRGNGTSTHCSDVQSSFGHFFGGQWTELFNSSLA